MRRSRGVRMRTRWRTEDMDRVRLCTRPHPACAFPDACGADKGGTCPTLHTRSYGVCRYGHAEADSGDRASVCAHGTPRRVQSRTRGWPYGAVLVRLCTRDAQACAKSDDASGGLPGACSTQEQELRRGRRVHALPDESVGAHRHRTSKTPDPGNDPHAKTTGPFVGRIAFEGADS